MGKKKSTPKPPAAPKVQDPVSVSTPFGSADYSNGRYNISSDTDSAYKNMEQSGQAGLQGWLSQINNPAQALAQQQQIYRNSMEPAFQMESDKRMADTIAGLGHRYQGTFGQLTAQQQALNEGLARANLEKGIYDSGQTMLAQNMTNTQNMGAILGGIQGLRYQPYVTLAQLLNPTGNNLANFNNANNANYQNQLNAWQAQNAQSQGSGNHAALGSMIGMGLGAIAAPFTGGLSLAAGASLGAGLGGAAGSMF